MNSAKMEYVFHWKQYAFLIGNAEEMSAVKTECVFQMKNPQLKRHYYVSPIPLNLVLEGTGVVEDFVR